MDGLEIIDPPQYSIAWRILAVLCALVIIALITTLVKLTRWLVERRAYAKRPGATDARQARGRLAHRGTCRQPKSRRAGQARTRGDPAATGAV